MSGLIYPISGHWSWGGGFLQQLGFHDFAGGGVVHMAGGMAALAGAMIWDQDLESITRTVLQMLFRGTAWH